MTPAFPERLSESVRRKGSALVLGLDPRPEGMPPDLRGDVTAFHERLVEICAPYIVGIKPQIAFFEALGERGLELWARTCALGRKAGLPVIGDVKRGDIGSTARAYARAHFRWADALTVHPWLGDDSVEPFLGPCREEGKGLFVLVATSNPGWERFQAREDRQGRPLYLGLAEAVGEWNESCLRGASGLGPVGAVVGATHPEVVERVREALPRSWLLLPGVGAQGARVADLHRAFLEDGTGALLPVGRGLSSCFEPSDPAWADRVEERAQGLLAEIREALPSLGDG